MALGLGGSRVGLGCMRLSTEFERDEARAVETIQAALDAGVSLLDTAHAYGLGEHDLGHNERLIARALATHPRGPSAVVVTKGGLSRPDGGWRPDGRAGRLRADAAASADALGRPPDVWLLHAPDPRVSFATSLRAMSSILDDGAARAVGLSNVTRAQLEQALDLLPVAAVEVALSPFDDAALRGGVVELCSARGIALLAHSPLGGPARAARLARDPVLAAVAAAQGISAQQVALAWLLGLAPCVVPLPGARTPERARAAAAAAGVALDDDQRARLAERFPAGALARPRVAAQPEEARGEVVIVMGIPGAGKTRAVAAWTARGYERLNRDERGGSLRALAGELERRLAAGASRVVLDNTYPTLAGRADVISIAWRHGLPVRCVWLDTPPPQAQANLCLRLVAEFGRLPGPEELRSSRLPGVMAPTSHMRAVRQMDAPREDEGFASIEVMAFVRERQEALRTGTIVALDQPEQEVVPADTPLLALGWQPGATSDDERAGAERLARELGRPVDVALCPHAGGPPVCWCRPPLPGLVVAWALRRGVDLARVRVAGDSPTLRTLARAFPG